MKLVIDIPDKIYNAFHKGNWSATYDGKKIRDIVMKGTPLPKGHGRLIDADEIQFENAEFDTYNDYSIAFDAIDQADTIIEADKEG